MKRILIGTIIGLTIGAAGTAGATANWNHQARGIQCYTGAADTSYATICFPLAGQGYGVAITNRWVEVYRMDTAKAVFLRYHTTG